jgi:site-specific recombinase XerD
VRSCDHWFKACVKAAGITDFHWHDIRHTFARLVQDGVPIERVSKLLGNKSIKMTMRYAHLAPNQLRDDVARLERLVQSGNQPTPLPTPERTPRAKYFN